MVFCCVPLCGIDSWTCDTSITFHEFPSNPDLAAKWIQQINSAITSKQKPMWFPRGKPVICSKHFLQTDFKDDSDTLKPRSIPTVFGHKYIGFNENGIDQQTSVTEVNKSPLIVNLIKPAADSDLVITDVFSGSYDPEDQRLNNESSKVVPSVSSYSKTTSKPETSKNTFLGSLQAKRQRLGEKLNQPIKINRATTGADMEKSPGHSLKFNSKISNFGLNANKSPNTFVKPSIIRDRASSKSSDIPKISLQNANLIQKKKLPKKTNSKSELIEIGPNTFLKINPDIIKVNKKQTPSGNTVLQFVMDQKLANSQAAADMLPKLVHGSTATTPKKDSENSQSTTTDNEKNKSNEMPNPTENGSNVVQHVLGHLVDTHVCKDSCAGLDAMEEDDDVVILDNEERMDKLTPSATSGSISSNNPVPSASETNKTNVTEKTKTIPNFLNKAPVLFTTSIPLSHCMMDKPKFLTQLKQKSRQIASLKFKIASLTKKVEELEDRCIVQERQLSYTFIKRLKTIRKNASKGDACATYILEQIRCYAGKNKMRWSDSTLSQCAVWVRKAPYAYEYFKKADFFKLPCLGTVKRFSKKHPELKFQNKSNSSNPNDDESSSDFDFEESDSEREGQENSDLENIEPSAACEAILTESNGSASSIQNQAMVQGNVNQSENQSNFDGEASTSNVQGNNIAENSKHLNKPGENTFPMTVDTSSLEVQEIILPSGEVVQCYSSNICNGTDVGNQYYIIPNVDQSTGGDHEYNVVQATDSLPVILQNLENAQLPLQQEQLIFITNSSDQLECTETEVVTAQV